MFNWRKGVLNTIYFLAGNATLRNLRYIKSIEFQSQEKLKQLQDERLCRLLLHAYRNVPYYKDILPAAGVIKNDRLILENFQNIPLLTKDIIRQQAERLYSTDYKKRGWYFNTSGGSTGEPVTFIQDKYYKAWEMADILYFKSVLGKQPGEREIKFWGSDRDIIAGSLTLKNRILNYLKNSKFFNSYRLDDKILARLIALNNCFRPKSYWSYMESALELAEFVAKHNMEFISPDFIVSTIGPLTQAVRDKIETLLKCKVYDQYGSREVGALASQCREQEGLHTFPWSHCLEIVDHNNVPVKEQEGRIIVTTLHNYSMPLIRFEIGDVAVGGGYQCSCGRNTFLLKQVLGRTLGYFKKSDGSLVHSHFLVQALFFKQWIRRFQIIQSKFNCILIRIEKAADAVPRQDDINEIAEKAKILMGPDCVVEIEFVDEIRKSESGKFLYTICKV